MQSEWNKGAACARDNILANIIGMQDDLNNNTSDPRYQILQKLLLLIEERYGTMCKVYKG